MTYHFTVPLPPRGKGRPRMGKGFVYTDSKTRSYEGAVAYCAHQALGDMVLEGPLRVDIMVVLPRPKRLMRRKDPEGLMWAPRKPDQDNCRKALLDGMKACWRDDAQVCDGRTMKVYSEKTGTARTEVAVSRLTDEVDV